MRKRNAAVVIATGVVMVLVAAANLGLIEITPPHENVNVHHSNLSLSQQRYFTLLLSFSHKDGWLGGVVVRASDL